MAPPVLHLLAGPNGAGKTTFYEEILAPATGLPFINADQLAAMHWPGEEMEAAYEASELAARQRKAFLDAGRSFVTETVFSHPSKLEFLRLARAADYLTHLHVMLIPEELAVARVVVRVEVGGHDVPQEKIRGRFARLWSLVREAVSVADETTVYDNSRAAEPFRPVARYFAGRPLMAPDWPPWTPRELRG